MSTTVLSKETAREVKEKLGFRVGPVPISDQLKAIQGVLKKNNTYSDGESSDQKAREFRLTFGQYHGKKIKELETEDRPYLMYLLSVDTKCVPVYVFKYLEQMAAELSGERFPDGTPMFFYSVGQYKGRSLAEVALEDKPYIQWTLANTDMIPESICPTVEEYISAY